MPRVAPLITVLAVVLAGCGLGQGATAGSGTEAAGPAGDDTARSRVVVTTSILGDLVSQLVGEDADVDVLMGPGADPHSFNLSASQATALREADLVVANGLGLEEGMLDALDAAEEDGANVFHVADHVDTIAFADAHGDGESHADEEPDASGDAHAGEDEHGHEGEDPHVWTDPTRVSASVPPLADAIAEVDDALEDDVWAQRGEDLVAQLAALDEEVAEILAVVPDDERVLVTSHEGFGYFAEAYDFEIVGTIVPGGSTLAEPSAAALSALVETVQAEGARAIFTENIDPSQLAQVVADEAGLEIEVGLLYSDSLSEADGPASTYEDYMRHNATTIADLLTR